MGDLLLRLVKACHENSLPDDDRRLWGIWCLLCETAFGLYPKPRHPWPVAKVACRALTLVGKPSFPMVLREGYDGMRANSHGFVPACLVELLVPKQTIGCFGSHGEQQHCVANTRRQRVQ